MRQTLALQAKQCINADALANVTVIILTYVAGIILHFLICLVLLIYGDYGLLRDKTGKAM